MNQHKNTFRLTALLTVVAIILGIYVFRLQNVQIAQAKAAKNVRTDTYYVLHPRHGGARRAARLQGQGAHRQPRLVQRGAHQPRALQRREAQRAAAPPDEPLQRAGSGSSTTIFLSRRPSPTPIPRTTTPANGRTISRNSSLRANGTATFPRRSSCCGYARPSF